MCSKFSNAIRFLTIDAVKKAKSGHLGSPMGMSEMAQVLWKNFLNHNPKNPNFINRDRFILSNGHASMLLYSLLHLTGYDISINDLKNFRQLNSKTPGHPELNITPGVETTTGPLGQGLANAIGMAISEKLLSQEFNTEEFNIIDHYTYVFVGDGCLMEGISHEVSSLAGTLGLNKLIVLYDDNNISIDGNVDNWFTENIPLRFESYNWHVIPNVNGHNIQEIEKAIKEAKNQKQKPSIICCKTIIGKGFANQAGKACTHGSDVDEEEIKNTRKLLNWNYKEFEIPKDIYEYWDATTKGCELENNWNKIFNKYKQVYPKKAFELIRRMKHKLSDDFTKNINKEIKVITNKKENIATRKSSQNCINILSKYLPELLGGSADLTPSNLTNWDKSIAMTNKKWGNYIHYGVREFGMIAIENGIFIHGGYRPFSGTFLMFSEYARNAIRMAALMDLGSIFVFTHDSIGLGEDGPTHQPVEQLSSLRQIPNINVWRPCDSVESLVAWSEAIKTINKPTCLVFSRQNLPYLEKEQSNNINKGAYIIKQVKNPVATIIATGSEVHLAIEAQNELAKQNIVLNVVSMPCTNIFDSQDDKYKKLVLLNDIPKIAIECGISDFWYKYVGLHGKIIGIDKFAKSAPANSLFTELGFTTQSIINNIKDFLKNK